MKPQRSLWGECEWGPAPGANLGEYRCEYQKPGVVWTRGRYRYCRFHATALQALLKPLPLP